MKQMNRILALALALIMVLGLATIASAATAVNGPFTVTVKNATGHEYVIYQIFTGSLATTKDENNEDVEILSDIKYGTDYTPDGVAVGAAAVVPEDPTTIVPTGTGTPMTTSGDTATATVTTAGYYMIEDVTQNLPDQDTLSAVMFQVVGNTVITSKHDATPITEKKIDDVNDSTGEDAEIEWHDSADHDIGDTIDFQLSAVIPGSIEAFREAEQAYPFTFHDVEEEGLTFTSIKRVYVVNGEVETTIPANQYQLITTGITDGCTFEVKFADLTDITAVVGGSKIVVEYQSKLNEKAIIGEEGNVNKMRGEFRNYNKPETPAYTPWDSVIAFTYKVVVNKVDENNEALAGAEFTLEKYNAATKKWDEISKVETEPGTTFTFKGLDDGNYRLTETETPAGYNSIDPIQFTVTADHDILWETQGRTDVLNTLTGNIETGEIEFTPTVSEGSLSSDVVNKAGTVLPETGGMGTTLFYAIGGLLVAAAVILLVTKKRMASAE